VTGPLAVGQRTVRPNPEIREPPALGPPAGRVVRSGPDMRFRLAKPLVLFAALLVGGCGGSKFDGRSYRGDGLAFRVGPVPESWRRIEVSEAEIAFRDDAHGATVAVNGRCGKDGDDVPLQALTHHLFLHFTDRQILQQQVVPLDGREALRSELVAELDGVPKRYTVYVLKKDGCVYDFIHIAALSAPETVRQDFERFVQGFSTLS
jgi:hypothetical protein